MAGALKGGCTGANSADVLGSPLPRKPVQIERWGGRVVPGFNGLFGLRARGEDRAPWRGASWGRECWGPERQPEETVCEVSAMWKGVLAAQAAF